VIEALRWIFEGEVEEGLFAAPGFLWLLLLVPVLAAIMVLMGRLHDSRLQRLFSGEVLQQVRPRGVRTRRTVRDVLLLVGITLGILSLAGPRFDKQVQIVQASGVDLVLVVDLSRSMDAQDVDPSRLERVRREIADLIDLMESDRVGLVIFAGGAYPRMPLSDDHQALRMLVEELSTRDFQAQGSALDQAIAKGVELLTRDETSSAGKAMVIFSDGEIHEPETALAAASKARDQGVRLFAVGVGESAAPIPLGQGLWQRDRQGRQVLSTPSPELLRDLARIGGGAYVDSVPSDRDMQRLYRGEIRGLLQAGVRDARPKIRWRQAWPWPLGGAVFCVLLAGWIGEGHRRWGLATAVLLAVGVALAAPSPALAATLPDADAAYRAGRYDEAARQLTELTHEQPDDAELFQRLGAARYRAGDYEGAVRAWSREAELRGDDPDTLFDLGNAHARAGRLERALELYDQVLEELPDDERAQTNRELIAAELERRRAMQPPPPEQQQEQEQQQGEGEQEGQPQEGEQQGEPQQQQGAEGDPQQGEQQGEEQEQQEGEGEEGEEGEQQDEEQQQSGSADGEREQSDREQSGDNPTEPQDSQGRKQTGEGQERLDESDVEGVDPDEVDQDAEGGQDGTPAPPEELTPEEAAARRAEEMLEGVQEGRPRVTIPGGSGDKPW